ncbi:hypothetical protein ACLOJK_034376 [Asimina triloba]
MPTPSRLLLLGSLDDASLVSAMPPWCGVERLSSHSTPSRAQPVIKGDYNATVTNYKFEMGPQVQMTERELNSSDELAQIRDCYEILSGIDLSARKPYETPRDHHPKYIFLNQYMFKAEIQIPFEFGVADIL